MIKSRLKFKNEKVDKMVKTMVYMDDNRIGRIIGGEFLLSTGQVMRELNISRMTLYRWMKLKNPLIKAIAQRFGKRTFYLFEEAEVERVKRLLPRSRGSGHQIISEHVLDLAKQRKKPNLS